MARRGGKRQRRVETAWQEQASDYAQRHGEGGDDLHATVVQPAVLRRLGAAPDERVLEVGCGPGLLGRLLASQGIAVTGIDAAPAMVEQAAAAAGERERYLVGDARELDAVLGDERFDHAAAILTLQDLDPIAPVLAGLARHVEPGGRLVIVLTHPAFRIPKQARWGWDEERGVQYRRVDAYLGERVTAITTRPGAKADTRRTTSYHRPLASYLDALGASGWGVTGCEELVSPRRGSPGRKAEAEERAAREIPMFLVLVATRLATGSAGA